MKTMKTPIVIPLHHSGGKLKDNTELRYALRSLARHFKDLSEIAVVCHTPPPWLTGVKHIFSSQGLKTALKDAANAYPDGFFWWYDDLTLLQDITGEDMKVTPAMNRWMAANTGWARSLEKIRERLVREGRPAYDYSRPHGPYWFDKGMVDEGFKDWPGMKSKFPWESWILSKRDWPRRFGAVKQYYGAFNGPPSDKPAYLNYNDVGNTPELRAWLESRFPEPCRYESVPPSWFFIHVPKTGGSSLLAAQPGMHKEPSLQHKAWRDPETQTAWENAGSPPVLAVVRHPVDRAVSIYHYFRTRNDYQPKEKKHVALGDMCRSMSLSDFWEKADITKMAEHIQHLRTQHSFIEGAADLRILRFESLQAGYKEAFGENAAPLPHLNSAPRGDDTDLSPAAIARIRQIYAVDFQRYYPKVEVHTIRFGKVWWVDFCGVTLDAWTEKHGHTLRIWRKEDINPAYPAEKFCEVDMLREFLKGDSDWLFYVDADVYVSEDAPSLFNVPEEGGFLIHNDNIVSLNRNWDKWCRSRWGAAADVCKGWRYKNAGVWACDRKAAEQMLAVIEEPYHAKVQEQHHWNWWICLAHSKGMKVHDLPVEWNSFTWRKEKAAFHHIAGKNKARKVNDLRNAGLIPMEQKNEYTKAFDFEPYRFTLAGPSYAPMDEMHIQMLHLACNLNAGRPAGKKVAVEIGSFNGASTSALIEAVNKGWLSHLHIVEVKPNATLRRTMSMCRYPERLTLHAKPYWETGIGYADIVFIDGDHKWPAVGDTLRALTWGSAVICMHDTNPSIFNCWGSVMAGNMLKEMKDRTYFEDYATRDDMVTHRGFLISAPQGTDLSLFTRSLCGETVPSE